jgi:hypothetical protein
MQPIPDFLMWNRSAPPNPPALLSKFPIPQLPENDVGWSLWWNRVRAAVTRSTPLRSQVGSSMPPHGTEMISSSSGRYRDINLPATAWPAFFGKNRFRV